MRQASLQKEIDKLNARLAAYKREFERLAGGACLDLVDDFSAGTQEEEAETQKEEAENRNTGAKYIW